MRTLRVIAAGAAVFAASLVAPQAASGAALGPRPDFRLPYACNTVVALTTYNGHTPVGKIDMYKVPGPQVGVPVLASADGYIHETFSPGGLEIAHGGGWFTVYLHMTGVRGIGNVKRGDVIGYVGTVGTSTAHLHYEQLANPNSTTDADNEHIVIPVIQGQVANPTPTTPFNMTSTNCGGGTTPPPSTGKQYVDTFANAPGHSSPGGTRTGTLYAGTNYVYCRARGPKVQVGSDWNTWWLRTDLDEGSPWQNQWVSAYYLSRWGNDVAKDNSGVDIRDC
ncbi:M23 family metallopeptidase [Herbidospora sp. RD11066]